MSGTALAAAGVRNRRLAPCRSLFFVALDEDEAGGVRNRRLAPCRSLFFEALDEDEAGGVRNRRLEPCRSQPTDIAWTRH